MACDGKKGLPTGKRCGLFPRRLPHHFCFHCGADCAHARFFNESGGLSGAIYRNRQLLSRRPSPYGCEPPASLILAGMQMAHF